MTDLLNIVDFNALAKKGGKLPLLVQLPVNPDSAPYLVSAHEGSKSAFVWVPKASENGEVRAAPRKDANFREKVVEEVLQQSTLQDWGNVQPLTKEGFEMAILYLEDYGLEDFDILVAEDVDPGLLPEKVESYVKDWMPEKTAVLLPKDRGFVGDVGVIATGHVVVVVHNPVRGLVVLR